MSEQIEWFGQQIEVDPKAEQPALIAQGEVSPNPCVWLYGRGPEGKKCGDCIHFRRYQQSTTWYKCEKRPTHTPRISGDHRVRWPVCKKYEEEQKG